jgi:DNA-binding LacI/PurR family transcriptional regulator
VSSESIVTIVDVAERAGVSVSTVSRILNDRPDVAAATRAKVLAVIEELGFSPHAQARKLAGGQAQTIAVLYPHERPSEDLVNPLQLEFALGAAAAAGAASFFCNLVTTPVSEDSLLGLYRRAQVDGVILMEVDLADWRVDLLRQHGLPFTMIGRCENSSGTDLVDLDVGAAVAAMFEHLADLGHRTIGFLTYAAHTRQRGFGPAVRAWRGYLAALERHGVRSAVRETGFRPPEMVEATHALLEDLPGLTAIATLTDASTGGVLQALAERGIGVPDAVSVIGLATDAMAQALSPPLTAIRFPAYDMGYRAAEALIRRISARSDDGDDHTIVAPELVLRGSTAVVADRSHQETPT